jgi:two-component system, OmpR family, sensor kinase
MATLDVIRVRLTAWYVGVLAAVLVAMSVGIYVLLGRALYARVDTGLLAVLDIAATSLANDIGEGQDRNDAAQSTADELFAGQQALAIFDERGTLLAERGRDDDLDFNLPPLAAIPDASGFLYTVQERDLDDDYHRLAVRRVRIRNADAVYIVVAGSSLDPVQEELDDLREILLYVVPVALVIVAAGGWLLARQSLRPVVEMTERQRRFMADASHELRTPLATAQTAAGVALRRAHRDEDEYREALHVVQQQTMRLSRLVDDMFILARVDAGNYPVRPAPLYLDELLEDVVRSAQVLATGRRVSIVSAIEPGVAFTGDEDLLRRMVLNLVDNAIRYAPEDTAVDVSLSTASGACVVTVTDHGPGVPAEARAHIFERFYRADAARVRSGDASGAGLGLSIAHWIAGEHGGRLELVGGDGAATTFRVSLPIASSTAARA